MTLTNILIIGGGLLIVWPLISRLIGAPQQTRPASFDTLAAVLASGAKVPSVPAPIKAVPPPSEPQTFEQALAALAAVRRRLSDTDTADEATLSAVEQITKALVSGSAK